MKKTWGNITFDEIASFLKKVEQTSGCWLWHGSLAKTGYGVTRWRGSTWLANRLSLVFRGGGVEETKLYALHSCNQPQCVSPHHLRWGTAKDNTADSIAFGSFCFGEKTGTAKVKEEMAREIFVKYHEGNQSIASLMQMSGLAKSQIFRIVNGISWARATKGVILKRRKDGVERTKTYRKIGDEDVMRIWNMWHMNGFSLTRIAKLSGVSNTMVGRIVYKKSYVDVTKDLEMLRAPGSKRTLAQLEHEAWERTQKESKQGKLSREQVIDIWKRFHSSNISQKDLAAKFKVSNGCVHCILTQKTWREITKDLQKTRLSNLQAVKIKA